MLVALLTMYVLDRPQTAQAGAANYEDTSPELQFVGAGWVRGASFPRASGGKTSYTSTPGDFVSFTFSGRSITYRYTMAANRGRINVYIDNLPQEPTFTAWAPEARWIVSQTYTTTPAPDVHTIKVEFAGTDPSHPSNPSYLWFA